MTYKLENILRYWRASLVDGTLGKGRFKRDDVNSSKFITLSKKTIESGVMSPKEIDAVFQKQAHGAACVSVRIRPLVVNRKTLHSTKIGDNRPEVVAPIVTEATISRDGKISPGRTIIARDILSPLSNDGFTIGTVTKLDSFLTTTTHNYGSWPKYLDHCRSIMDSVAAGWPNGDKDYLQCGTGLLETTYNAETTICHIRDLYDDLQRKKKPCPPLLKRYALASSSRSEVKSDIEFSFAARLGHSNVEFPLSYHQQEVLSCLADSHNGEVIAVNGPPGTGKTTMLLSAIADAWVHAAVDERAPPIIVAASSNNQAVTNIIDAFAKDFSTGKGAFSGRWLPDIESFGLFLPSKTKEMSASKNYQTEGFFLKLETEEYVSRAHEAYLEFAGKAFPHIATDLTVEDAVSALHSLISKKVAKLSSVDLAREKLEACRSKVADELGVDLMLVEAYLNERLEQGAAVHERLKVWFAAWERNQAGESALLALFGFLPPIAKKRLLRARITLQEAGCTMDFSECADLDDVEQKLTETLQLAKKQYQTVRKLHGELQRAQVEWEKAVAALGVKPRPVTDVLVLDRIIDCQVRFQLFQLATHYWEGRWLMEMLENLDTIVSSHEKTGLKTVVPRWQRRMMLTPCAVATFATLPSKMIYQSSPEDGFKKKYLYNFIDLLIVDEAGQVLPEVAGASFSLAKRALVIGDRSILCIGSYNWLSADRQGKYARHETSFVYQGANLKHEIEVIENSLFKRTGVNHTHKKGNADRSREKRNPRQRRKPVWMA